MTPRPGFVPKRRPLSAIFLGDPSSSSPSSLPDLPEPPSPGAESIDSNASGLPSPPATNSTGSGGDNKSNDGGSVRRRSSVSDKSVEMASNRRMSRSSSPGDDDEDTARFAAHARRQSSQTTADNAAALQRVMSLTQRNRMAMEKLSRLNSPSPSGRPARSPLPPLTGPPSSSSSSSSSRPSHAHTHSFPSSSPGLSGSETERERYTYSSDEMSATPPASVSRSSHDPRERVLSLPTSPPRTRRAGSRTSSPGPSVASSTQRTPRKRVSLMSAPDSDVATAALAAVASLRRSPTLSAGRRSRQPLPREFFDTNSGSDGRTSKEPSTPQKAAMRSLAGSPSPRKSTATRESLQLSPHKLPQRTSSMTAREVAKRHSTRWQSEDLNAPMYDDELTTTGRRQMVRAGSMENTLGARLVGDSLRAAGIGMRKEGAGDDLFSSTSSHETSPDNVRERPPNGRSSSVLFDPRTPGHREYAHARPATSMADFGYSNAVPQTAPPAARSHASQFIERNREGIGIQTAPRTASRASDAMPPPPLRAPNFTERTYGSPRPRMREQTPTQSSRPTSADEQSQEHLRLASEALSLFDTQLSRLGDSGQIASTVVPDVFRDAQALVRFTEQLNGMLRTGTNRALERQIEAEVDDEVDAGQVDMVVLWQDVGADFRDCLRSSDELVRTMSNFLLGAGKLLKELKNQRDAAVEGGQHARGYSLDSGAAAHDARSSTASSSQKSGSRTGSGNGVLDGRRSVDSRRSLDAARAERDRDQRVSLDGLRPAEREVRSVSRTEARRSLQLRERESTSSKSPEPQPIQPQRPSTLAPSSSMRRIITPRETENRARVIAVNSPECEDVDPSPTPPARIQNQPSERLRGLAPLAIPKPLEQLPSEVESGARSAIRRVSSAMTNRRKTSTTSNMTVRPPGTPAFAVPPTPGATTALTPATANSRHNAEKMSLAFPTTTGGANVSRHASDSNAQVRTGTWRNVTFSRATAASTHRERERKRTISATSGTSPAEVTDAHAYAATPVYTGRTAALRNGGGDRERGSASDAEQRRPATLSRRATGGVALARASLDEERAPSRTLGRSERRRTLTEVFAPH
ncbi:hypothetical protein PENSPDRAFT_683068 [Peniophora sp. CONT]|nr:hypothetical protein PENSPDRAFT_683068 [Peniophora sp. CONT]